MGQGTLSLSSLAVDGCFPGQASGSTLTIGRRQCAPVPSGRAPGPSRAGFLYIKSTGRVESAAVALGSSSGRAPEKHLPPVAALLGQRTLSPVESSEGFPPGPCAAPSSRSCCWLWSSARRLGGQLPRYQQAQVEALSWPRCIPAAATGLWVSVPPYGEIPGLSFSEGLTS